MFPQVVQHQFKEQLQAALAGEERSKQARAKASVRSKDDDRWASLLHFLETGSLPWSMADQSTEDARRELRVTAMQNRAQLADSILRHAPGPAWYFHLFQILSSDEQKLFVQTVLAQMHGRRQDVEVIMETLFAAETQGVSTDVILLASAAILSDVVCGTAAVNPPDVHAMLERVARRDQLNQLESLWTLLPEGVRMALGQERFQTERETIQSSIEEGSTLHPGGTRPVHASDREDHELDVMDGRSLVSAAAREDEEPETEAWQESLYPLYVHHAGLVLLHPFLPRLFEHVDLTTSDSKDPSPFKLPKAAALLHFLATGRQSVDEFELGLIKVLLGMKPETPLLISEGMLTERETRETHVLLQSVIEHWSALKNTSIDGLRFSFLQRPGLLREEEAGWKLQVESKPYDMLMNRLPWRLSVVRLPWMTSTLYIEWPTL